MAYGSLQAEFMGTEHNVYIWYGTPIFGNIIFLIVKSIANGDKMMWKTQVMG